MCPAGDAAGPPQYLGLLCTRAPAHTCPSPPNLALPSQLPSFQACVHTCKHSAMYAGSKLQRLPHCELSKVSLQRRDEHCGPLGNKVWRPAARPSQQVPAIVAQLVCCHLRVAWEWQRGRQMRRVSVFVLFWLAGWLASSLAAPRCAAWQAAECHRQAGSHPHPLSLPLP